MIHPAPFLFLLLYHWLRRFDLAINGKTHISLLVHKQLRKVLTFQLIKLHPTIYSITTTMPRLETNIAHMWVSPVAIVLTTKSCLYFQRMFATVQGLVVRII